MPKKLLFVILIYFTTPNMTYLQENLLQKAFDVYTGQGDIEKAIALVDNYIAIHPNDFTGYLNKAIFVRQKGIISQNQKYFHETIELLNKARDLNKQKVSEEIILGNLATTYLEMQDVNNAIKMYEIALESSKRAFYKVKIAYAHARQGNIQKAISLVEQLSYDEMLKCIFRFNPATCSGSKRPLFGRERNVNRRWITTPKWVMLPLFKGGSNGPNEVIHAKNQRSLAAESRGAELPSDRPIVSHRQGDGAGVFGTSGGGGSDLAASGGLDRRGA
jgi:hypothetical protein